MKFKSSLFVGAVALAATSLVAVSANADKLRWKMQSTWGSQVAINGEAAVYFSNKVKSISGGDVQLRFHEPNALVPSLEVWDAVKNGSVDAGYTTPGYHAGKIPAVSYFTAVPFGPGASEYHGWMEYGGGQQLKDRIYGEYGLKALNCLTHAPETSGWFRKKINNVEELKGMKMRFFGLGAKVMSKIGMSTQLLAGADIYPALERGVIDATEYSMPTNDIKYGFYQIAKNNYFPRWHQQASVSEYLMNKPKYDALPKAYQEMIQSAAMTQVIYTHADADSKQFGAMATMQNKHGVKIHRWKDSQLAVFEKAWNEVVAEESAKDALFKEFADSYFAFRKGFKIWGDAQAMKPTYLD